ncbi:nucleotidyltransferase domain-containing protein [Arthrobacter sp. UYEF20]|uniref:nucleotidyltransferase domain-containing protein n=1 Tax=Arthrobacter sp. UYEF20 TaxID=1756363 RepID=UPI003391AD2B
MGVLYVLARADAEFTVPQIVKLLPERGSLAGVRKALNRLTEHGVVLERVAGRTHTYHLNREHLIADAVVAMATAKTQLADRIRREVSSWEFAPRAVKIFGSAARNEMRTDSDIDIFIALPNDVDDDLAEERIAALAMKISAWTGNDARPLVYREREIRPAPIFESIAKEGLDIAGKAGWLRQALRSSRVPG